MASRTGTRCIAVALSLAALMLGHAAPARAKQRAAFSLIIGVNKSVDAKLKTLRYADDDAVRYFGLFRALGHRIYLLTRPDKNTKRLHPQAAAEADAPRRAQLLRVVRLLAADIAKAKARGLETVVYFVYAGHGNIKAGEGYLGLEDYRLSGRRIRQEVLDPLHADRVHLIVDACHSYYLVHSRGPGGKRRPVRGFSRLGSALTSDRIGLLLSTSAARESHEWAAIQAGVFSHEVRSGLYGAADANGDGQVSYREIAAFVQRANASIPNERFRPHVFARPPKRDPLLLDLRRPRRRRALYIAPQQHGRYLLETQHGVRLLDFHSSARAPLTLVRPSGGGILYLRRIGDDREYAIPAAPAVVKIASLEPKKPRAAQRGAAHHAFSQIFAKPYDQSVVARYRFPPPPTLALADNADSDATRPRWRSIVGWSALGLGAAALAGGLYSTISALRLRDDVDAAPTHRDASQINDSIARRNVAAVVLYSVAGTALVGGLVALLWPRGDSSSLGGDRAASAQLAITPHGATITLGARF